MERQPTYHLIRNTSPLGIHIDFYTMPGGYFTYHWHNEIELLYPLNGVTDIGFHKEFYRIPKKHFTLIESRVIHNVRSDERESMFLCIHLSKKALESYLPNITLSNILCHPGMITDENFPQYRGICELFEQITRLYIEDSPTFLLEAEGITLQICARLLRYFSSPLVESSSTDQLSLERMRTIIAYVEEHFRDSVSLDEITDMLSISKEHFCRFFKKNTGISFLQYVSEIRLMHAYEDLQQTQLSINEIMERNGFSTQKIFNSSFKKMYGITPSVVRKKQKMTFS